MVQKLTLQLYFPALNKSKSEADAIKKQTEALAKDYDHLLQHQNKLQVIISTAGLIQLHCFNFNYSDEDFIKHVLYSYLSMNWVLYEKYSTMHTQ